MIYPGSALITPILGLASIIWPKFKTVCVLFGLMGSVTLFVQLVIAFILFISNA